MFTPEEATIALRVINEVIGKTNSEAINRLKIRLAESSVSTKEVRITEPTEIR